MVNEPKRQLFVLKPDSEELSESFRRLIHLLDEFEPEILSPKGLRDITALDGNVLLVPPASWPHGVLSDLTRFADLSILAVLGSNEGQDRVKLWYFLGASLVLDETATAAVFQGALTRLLDEEVQTLRPQLTRKENMLFEVLRRAGKAGVDRATLAERIWENVAVQEKTIDVHIFNLRRKLNSTRFRVICEARKFILVELANSDSHMTL